MCAYDTVTICVIVAMTRGRALLCGEVCVPQSEYVAQGVYTETSGKTSLVVTDRGEGVDARCIHVRFRSAIRAPPTLAL